MTDTPLLALSGLTKAYPGVVANDDVSLRIAPGEVHALLGENGAGKSTLIKILGGAHVPDAGEISIDGKQLRIDSPQAAQQAGIGIIYQEFNLVPALTARENIFLGQHRNVLSWLHATRERQEAMQLFERIGIKVDPEMACRDLTVAQQQIVEIAKALSLNARIVVMDEPTAALTPREVEGLARVIQELKAQGIGIIYISHRLDEVEQLADRMTVLRDGRLVGTRPMDEVSRDQMIEMMVGRSLDNEFPARESTPAEECLAVRGLTITCSERCFLLCSKGGNPGYCGTGWGRTNRAGTDDLWSGSEGPWRNLAQWKAGQYQQSQAGNSAGDLPADRGQEIPGPGAGAYGPGKFWITEPRGLFPGWHDQHPAGRPGF